MLELVEDGKVVQIHYTLRDTDGAELESSRGGPAMPYLHGAGNIVPGLERQLFGSLVGTHHHNLEVVPVEGYGELQDFKRQQIPIEEFEGVIGLRPGFPVIAEDGDGQAVTLWVTDVQDDHVEIDINHPMAGKTLFFDVEIVAIRDATAEEMAHGHPRGLDDTQGH